MPVSTEDLLSLRRSYLFAGLDEPEYQQVMAYATTMNYNAGQGIFTQEQNLDAIYWVADGLVRLYRTSPQGDEKVIELVGPGRTFAEAALFMGGRYPVSAAAQNACRLIAIDGTHFKAWLAQDTNRCFRLMAAMSARLHKMVNEIDRLTLMKGADRLLQYLLDHSDPDETGREVVELEAPKQVIASRIGVKPETFSRLLHKLTDLGCVELKDNRLYISDPDKLRQTRIE